MYEETACSNCKCPINYDCQRFQLFFEGKYIFVEEFTYNQNDNTCEHKPQENAQQQIQTLHAHSLF